MDDFFDNWTVQVRKGVLELCLLSALETGELYGYALVKTLSATPGLSVAEGSIYPLLSRMKNAGLVASRLEESPSGPARKYYSLTDAGRDRLRLMRPYFESLVRAVAVLNKS
ncbi:MAG: PadR family transcriptional regulator [Verrucomicrobiales bacterium]|nr:PadR family transcriptional regulator [Verrucomicrobiales bacterium]